MSTIKYKIVKVESTVIANVGYSYMHYVIPATSRETILDAVFVAISHERCADWIVNKTWGRSSTALVRRYGMTDRDALVAILDDNLPAYADCVGADATCSHHANSEEELVELAEALIDAGYRNKPARELNPLQLDRDTLAKVIQDQTGEADEESEFVADAVIAHLTRAEIPGVGESEWGVRFYGRGPSEQTFDTREEAEDVVRRVPDKYAPAVLVKRAVGPWVEVTP